MKSYLEAKKMTKAELLEEYREIIEKYEDLESENDNLDEWAAEQESVAYEANKKLEEFKKLFNPNVSIISVSDFKRRLSMEDLLNDELEEFIDNYLRYYNKAGEQIK